MPPTINTSSITEHMLVEASTHAEPVKMQGRTASISFKLESRLLITFAKAIHKHADGNCSKYDHLYINIKIQPTPQGLSHMKHTSRNVSRSPPSLPSTYELSFFLQRQDAYFL